jgi:hypothetical protein
MDVMLRRFQQDLALALQLALGSNDREVFIRGRELSYGHARQLIRYISERAARSSSATMDTDTKASGT